VKIRYLFALLAFSSLIACSKEEAPANLSGSLNSPNAVAATPNSGRILQLMQAGGYTYAEVQASGNQKVWIAGGPIQLKVGDSVQWADYAVMRNFTSKSLGRTFEEILFVSAWGAPGGFTAQVAPHGAPSAPQMASTENPAPSPQSAQAGSSQGQVKSSANAGGYTYIEVDQRGSTVWIAAPKISVQTGDRVTWSGGALMQNFAAKTLGRTFDEIIFVGGVTVVQ
jgi:hypothetical protein